LRGTAEEGEKHSILMTVEKVEKGGTPKKGVTHKPERKETGGVGIESAVPKIAGEIAKGGIRETQKDNKKRREERRERDTQLRAIVKNPANVRSGGPWLFKNKIGKSPSPRGSARGRK